MDIGHGDSHVPTAGHAAISLSCIEEFVFGEKVMLRKRVTVRREVVD
jgi:hypothetical protein